MSDLLESDSSSMICDSGQHCNSVTEIHDSGNTYNSQKSERLKGLNEHASQILKTAPLHLCYAKLESFVAL